jgi:hypothetical protein
MVTGAPTAPEETERLDMLGAGTTVKFDPALGTPPAALTTTLPVVAPGGTVAVMLEVPQVPIVAVLPLNFTLPLPCDGPKFAPLIVIKAPTAPELGDKPLMLGAGVTVKVTPELACPPTVTTTGPAVAPVGTGAVMLVPLQLVGVAVVTLNFKVLLTCDDRKFVPAITIDEPTAPILGVRLEIVGGPVGVGRVICES